MTERAIARGSRKPGAFFPPGHRLALWRRAGLLVCAFLTMGADAMAEDKRLEGDGPPLTYRLDEVKVVLTRQPGSGPFPMRRITLSGSGSADFERGGQNLSFRYSTPELMRLLNDFYRIRFFNLQTTPTARHSVALMDDGTVVTSSLRPADAAPTSVCLSLAAYQKCVTYATDRPQELELLVSRIFSEAERLTSGK